MNDVMLFDIIQCICEDKIWESKYKLEMIITLLCEERGKIVEKEGSLK